MPYGTVLADVIQSSVSGVSLGAGNATNFKNRIINGDFRIDQRNAGASITPTGLVYCLDRWRAELSQSSKYSVQQNAGSVTPPAGFTNYLGVTSLSSYSLASGDYFAIAQRIEGYNIADLGFGTANAKTLTLSFWVRSSLTGTFGGAFRNEGATRSYPFSYTISSANTWEQKSVTFTADTTGTWYTNNANGLEVWMSLGTGTTYSGTANAWAATNYASVTGATSVVGTNGATFYITGVQLEVGSSATGFEYRDYGRELMMCQRYYYKQSGAAQYIRLGNGFAGGTTTAYTFTVLPVAMRAKPSSIDYTGAIGLWAGGTIYSVSALTVETSSNSPYTCGVVATSSGITTGAPYILLGNNDATSALAYNAEL